MCTWIICTWWLNLLLHILQVHCVKGFTSRSFHSLARAAFYSSRRPSRMRPHIIVMYSNAAVNKGTIKPTDWQRHARVWERYPLSPSSWTELLVKKHFSASKMWHWRTVKELPRVEVPSDLRSATIYIEVSCMTSNIFWGGGKSYRHQLRERHHIHCCIWHIWLLCAQWWVI